MSLDLPDPKMQIIIRKEFNENLKTRDEDVQTIKDWLKLQPHLPDTMDDLRILNFLRGCKFSLEKCKRKIDYYFTMKAALPEFFANCDAFRPEIQKLFEYGIGVFLPSLTPEGKRVIVVGTTHANFDTPDIADAFKIGLMLCDLRLGLEEHGVAGDVYIFDASVATARHFAKVSPVTIRKMLVCGQRAYPFRVTEVHVINPSSVVEVVFNVARPFLKDKIRSRVRVHSSLESLHECVPRDVLPEEYGGKAGRLEELRMGWFRKLQENRDWFKEQEKYKADESKRPVIIDYQDLFGMEGSFRKLRID